MSIFRRLFRWRQPSDYELDDTRRHLYLLSKNRLACERLAAALEIETDAGESAASFLAECAAEEAYRAKVQLAQRHFDRTVEDTEK